MLSKKIVIITVEQSYRAICIDENFKRAGYDVTTICLEDYSMEKIPSFQYLPPKQGVKYEKVLADFYKNSIGLLNQIMPRFVYTFLPHEDLAEMANKWCKKNDAYSLVDVNEVETSVKLSGSSALKGSDLIIVPVEAYKTKLKSKELGKTVSMPYFNEIPRFPIHDVSANDKNEIPCGIILNENININELIAILKQVNATKKVKLAVVGNCSAKEYLFNELYKAQIEVKDYGEVDDENALDIIVSKWYFAFNILNSDVLGLNKEAIIYLRHGLALINNVRGDLEEWIRKSFAGFNTFEMNLNQLGDKIVRTMTIQINSMKHNAGRVYIDNLSKQNCTKSVDYIVNLFRGK